MPDQSGGGVVSALRGPDAVRRQDEVHIIELERLKARASLIQAVHMFVSLIQAVHMFVSLVVLVAALVAPAVVIAAWRALL